MDQNVIRCAEGVLRALNQSSEPSETVRLMSTGFIREGSCFWISTYSYLLYQSVHKYLKKDTICGFLEVILTVGLKRREGSKKQKQDRQVSVNNQTLPQYNSRYSTQLPNKGQQTNSGIMQIDTASNNCARVLFTFL
eukprot:TRINITY_DN19936_c0_g1_i1.p3 TRINITY_DN19936_c0_g1~~TRINITY_DN19936_c0_g1_i1.p3  ORF type:complete len:137 (+),score=4.05 TRINITY_DN19936_c0_g1_i1:544-954(+)